MAISTGDLQAAAERVRAAASEAGEIRPARIGQLTTDVPEAIGAAIREDLASGAYGRPHRMPSQETPTSLRAESPDFLEQQGAAEAHLMTAAKVGEVFTAGSWFWRLARVVARPGQGAPSRTLAASSEDERRRMNNTLDQLPAEIGLLSMRRLVPVMAALPGQLNLLTAEAVAAAVVLGARIAISTASPLVTTAA